MALSVLSKAHKVRKIVAMVTLISGLSTGALTVVAFTGRVKGNFTINLTQEGVRLAMDETPDLANPTTFLKIDDYPQFATTTYSFVQSHGDLLDSSSTNHKVIGLGAGGAQTDFFKYTFYVKNMGSTVANFVFSVNITEMTRPTNNVSYGYDSLLRVMVFNNSSTSDLHENTVYAKAAEYKNPNDAPKKEDGTPELREPVAVGEGQIIGGYAEPFTSSRRICEIKTSNFLPGSIKRYSVVAWLEGSDAQCAGEAPQGGSLQLGINIDGEEHK